MAIGLSVIIPSYNRCAILRQTLEALLRCAEADRAKVATNFEIVVMDDGSLDNTAGVVAELAMRANDASLHYVRQPVNRGAAAARNSGLRQATGEIVLFLDSDIVAAPGLLAQHVLAHCLDCEPSTAFAWLGHLLLQPGLPATPINLNHAIHKWRNLKDGQELDWRYFVTGNVSVRRSFLLDNGLWFDESLPFFEDTELGYRSCKKGLRIFYNARAVGYHNHNLTLQGYLQLSQSYGETLAVLHQRSPELKRDWDNYLSFSWRNPPGRIARDVVRPLVLNRLSVALLLWWARTAERTGGCASAAVIRRIGNYYERLGYQQQGPRD
jgi:glycosyltransferase involved in cell wall biosynthesis